MAQHDVRRFVTAWARKIFRYAQENPVETATTQYPPSQSYLQNVIKRQATPSVIKGMPLMILFGKDVTIEDFIAEETFIGGNSRAGRLTVDMLARLHQYETWFWGKDVDAICGWPISGC